jgi:large conductance mechanosensitive channel
MKKFFQDFKAFALRGNVLDLAVGVIIGGAFGKIVSSLVNDLIMPLIGLLLGGFNLSGAFYALDGKTYASIAEATDAGAGTLNYGLFIQTVIDFLIVALCIFLFLRIIARILPKKKEEAPAPDPRLCPFCLQPVHDKATRCPHCTSQL